jgi:anti-anti-sigma factor
MQYEINECGDCRILAVAERELRFDLSEEFKKLVFGFLESGDKNLIVDIGAVEFLDSTALSTFVAAHNRLTSLSRRFALCCVHQKVMNILRLTSLDRHFTVTPTRDDACRVLGVAPGA